MTKQHHQGTRAETSPGPGLATQPGDPGAVPPKLANTSGAAPGTYCGWDPCDTYTGWDRIRDERRAERDEREHYHDDWKHKDRRD